MTLRDYLHVSRLTAAEFARGLGIHPNYMRLIKNGKAKAGYELASKIEIATGGQVTLKELRGYYEGS